MPALNALEDSFAERDAVILYISIDETSEQWKVAADSLLQDTHTLSYRVSNKFASKQFESFDIQYIPRYFLINQQGQVVQSYAPGPAEEELDALIAGLLGAQEN